MVYALKSASWNIRPSIAKLTSINLEVNLN